jgi:hypothetical protein
MWPFKKVKEKVKPLIKKQVDVGYATILVEFQDGREIEYTLYGRIYGELINAQIMADKYIKQCVTPWGSIGFTVSTVYDDEKHPTQSMDGIIISKRLIDVGPYVIEVEVYEE